MDREEVEVHKHAKKERGQYLAILNEQAWSIKDILYGIKHQNMINFPGGTKHVSRAGKLHLALPCSPSHREIRLILPAYGASHIVSGHIVDTITQ